MYKERSKSHYQSELLMCDQSEDTSEIFDEWCLRFKHGHCPQDISFAMKLISLRIMNCLQRLSQTAYTFKLTSAEYGADHMAGKIGWTHEQNRAVGGLTQFQAINGSGLWEETEMELEHVPVQMPVDKNTMATLT